MIAVIADDFTGAAEIGGIGLRYGLKVVIDTKVEETYNADLLVIATDTRSMKVESARQEVINVTQKLLNLKPRFIYKKLDSVLRGNVADELFAQLQVENKQRAIIIAGNPSFGRIIKNGNYFVKNKFLSETSFANDPEFPIRTSLVEDIVGHGHKDVVSKCVDCQIPEKGIVIGDVTCHSDVINWADKINNNTIAAGGSGFFDVLLSKDFTSIKKPDIEYYSMGQKTLLVFGSTYPKGRKIINRLDNDSICKMNMPDEIYNNNKFNPLLLEEWAKNIADKLKDNKKAIITIDHNHSDEPGLSVRLRENIAQLVGNVIEIIKIDDLIIEGGATTSMILKYMGISILYPIRELAMGIIQMKADEYPELCITTKPGSYSWPDNVVFEEIKIPD